MTLMLIFYFILATYMYIYIVVSAEFLAFCILLYSNEYLVDYGREKKNEVYLVEKINSNQDSVHNNANCRPALRKKYLIISYHIIATYCIIW